jgi:hypothetical protein
MEAVVALAEGDQGVRRVGVVEYVNQFFDVIDDDAPRDWRDNSCLTPEEIAALEQVHRVLKGACEATPQMVTDDEFIASGWPAKVQPAAAEALSLMQERGRFSEELEEAVPGDQSDDWALDTWIEDSSQSRAELPRMGRTTTDHQASGNHGTPLPTTGSGEQALNEPPLGDAPD